MATSSYLVPILATGAVSFFDNWYQTKQVDLKIPVATAVAGGLGALIATIPGMGPVVAGVAWVAFAAALITGPAASVATSLVGGLNTKG
jgi:hypothetical protein